VLATQSQLVCIEEARDKQGAISPGAGLGAQDLPYALGGAVDADLSAYQAAIARLENEADVDMVLVSVQDTSDTARLGRIYADVISHCDRMSALSQGRIGFGEVPGNTPEAIKAAADKLTGTLVSDRFVLVAPPAWWARWPA
jgi:hypothetical protein